MQTKLLFVLIHIRNKGEVVQFYPIMQFYPIVGVYNCSMYCCTLLYVHSSIAIILMGKRELIALLNLSSWCLVMVERLFLAVPRGCLQFMIVVFLIILTYYFWYHVCHIVLYVHCSLVLTCWERADLLTLLNAIFPCAFVTFPYGILV